MELGMFIDAKSGNSGSQVLEGLVAFGGGFSGLDSFVRAPIDLGQGRMRGLIISPGLRQQAKNQAQETHGNDP